MPRFHYRDLADRYAHLDGTFTGFELDRESWDARYKVRFHPGWAHPDAPREDGLYWSSGDEPDAVEVTVFARNVRSVRLEQGASVVDWGFHEVHSLLLPYEPTVTLYCNDRLGLEQVRGLVDAVEAVTRPWVSAWDFVPHTSVSRLAKVASRPSFCLGNLPVSLARQVRLYLGSLGASVFPEGPDPERGVLPKVLLMDRSSYLIADDFELDIPESVHRPDAFKR